MADELAVEVHQLVKRFGGRVTAVDGLDLAACVTLPVLLTWRRDTRAGPRRYR